MVKKTTNNTRIVGVKSSTVAMFEGVFAAVLGLGVAILYSLQNSVDIATQTQSVLGGLVFGMAAGIVSIIVIPLVYFGLGFIVGYVHGFVFNVIAESSGGLVFRMEDEK